MTTPEGRPYNADQLLQITAEMRANGSTTLDAPTPPLPTDTIVHQPGFEHHYGPITSAITAVTGLAKFLTSDGRGERNANLVQKLEKELEVTEWVGGRIDRPRTQTGPTDLARIGWVGGPQKAAGEKIGWVGTHKRESKSDPRSENLRNLGFQLIDAKNVTTGQAEPNLNRPVTRRELRAETRLGKIADKERALSRNSRWLSSDGGASLNRANGHRLSVGERWNASKTTGKILRSDRKADRLARKFAKIETGSGIRGQITRERLRLAHASAYKRTNKAIRKGRVTPLPPPPNLPPPPQNWRPAPPPIRTFI